MLKASTLYYTLIFSMILGITIALIMSLFMSFNTANIRIQTSKNFIVNLNSVLHILENNSKYFPMNQITEMDLFSDQNDSISVYRLKHGALDVYKVRAHRNQQYLERPLMMGWKSERKVSLYLADNTFPLSLCGETKVEGNAFIPGVPIKRAYIEGKNYVGDQLIYGGYTSSKRQVDKIESLHIADLRYQMEFHSDRDSLITFSALEKQKNSFMNRRWLLKSDGLITFDQVFFEGNLTIVSSHKIVIGSNTMLKDVVFIAPEIEIMDYVKGEFQCLATQSIQVGKQVELEYPSNLMLLESKENGSGGLLEIEEGSTIQGAVMILTEKEPRISKSSPQMRIKKNVKVEGIIYTPYRVTLSPSIQVNGSMYCKETELKTPSAVYTNHLLDCKITPSALDKAFISTISSTNNKTQKMIKWLN